MAERSFPGVRMVSGLPAATSRTRSKFASSTSMARRVPVFKGHEGAVTAVAWSPDGKQLVSSSRDKTVRVWNLDGTPGPVLKGHEAYVDDVAWSPDGKWIVSAGEDSVTALEARRDRRAGHHHKEMQSREMASRQPPVCRKFNNTVQHTASTISTARVLHSATRRAAVAHVEPRRQADCRGE